MSKIKLIIFFIHLFTLQLIYCQENYAVLFSNNSSKISNVEYQNLKTSYNDQIKHTKNINLSGHTDNVGDSLYNINLSAERVVMIRNLLIEWGYDPNKISNTYAGENVPLNNNANEKERQLNRRVELKWEDDTKITEIDTAQTGNIQDLYDLLVQEKQEFCINPNRDTVLFLQKGTIINIPANSFNTNLPNCVIFKTKEVYERSEMIVENLSTMSGHQLLESGGMIYTEAFDVNGNSISLNDGKFLTIMMPTDTLLDGMSLFNGRRNPNTNRINWNYADYKGINGFNLEDCMPYIYLPDTCEQCRIFFCRLIGRMDETIKGSTNPEIKKLNQEFRDCQKTWRKNPAALKTFATYYDSTGCFNLMTDFGAKNWRELQDTLNAIRNQRMQAAFAVYGVDNYIDYQDTLYKIILQQRIEYKIEQDRLLRVKFAKYNVDSYEAYQDTLRKIELKKMEDNLEKSTGSVSDLKFYIAKSNNLGWVNCDRFPNYPNKIDMLTDLPVNKETDCMIVFTGMKSVMQGYRFKMFRFNTIPRDLDIWVLAIKYHDGEAYIYLEKTVVKHNISIQEFKKVSLEELKKALLILDE